MINLFFLCFTINLFYDEMMIVIVKNNSFQTPYPIISYFAKPLTFILLLFTVLLRYKSLTKDNQTDSPS